MAYDCYGLQHNTVQQAYDATANYWYHQQQQKQQYVQPVVSNQVAWYGDDHLWIDFRKKEGSFHLCTTGGNSGCLFRDILYFGGCMASCKPEIFPEWALDVLTIWSNNFFDGNIIKCNQIRLKLGQEKEKELIEIIKNTKYLHDHWLWFDYRKIDPTGIHFTWAMFSEPGKMFSKEDLNKFSDRYRKEGDGLHSKLKSVMNLCHGDAWIINFANVMNSNDITCCGRIREIEEEKRRKQKEIEARRLEKERLARERQIEKENQTYINMLKNCFVTVRPNSVRWVQDDQVQACHKCNQLFGICRRRHHCRQCGNVFCHQHCKSDYCDYYSTQLLRRCENCKNSGKLLLLEQQFCSNLMYNHRPIPQDLRTQLLNEIRKSVSPQRWEKYWKHYKADK
jgi:hypothetical protein